MNDIDGKNWLLARTALAILTSEAVTCVVYMPDSDETVIEAITAELGFEDLQGDELIEALTKLIANK